MKNNFIVLIAFISTLAVCKGQSKHPENNITDAAISAHIKKLASDEFVGRKPGTKGEELTTKYIAKHLGKSNIDPANGSSYFQNFTIKEIEFLSSSNLQIYSDNGKRSYKYGKDFHAKTTMEVNQKVTTSKAELIFVGFGITSSGYKWDDYKNVDVKGKIVVVLKGDPGMHTKNPKLFNGERPSYYGGIKYKKKEALKRGAVGLLVIQGKDQDWTTINQQKNPLFPGNLSDLASDGLHFSGFISKTLMKQLIINSGSNFDPTEKGLKKEFTPISLKSKASITLKSTVKNKINTKNVVGILKGSKRPNEYIIYTAHWDHIGTRSGHLGKDSIFNGAIDNASGTAMQLEVAKAFSKMNKKPERSIIFLFTSAEEMGLFGAEYYANNPLYPLNKTACVINADASFAVEKMRMVINVANGFTEMDTLVSIAAKKIGRGIYKGDPNTPPPGNVFKRSDHFPFVKKGVPAVWNVGNFDPINGDKSQEAKIGEFIRKHYHKVTDEYYDGFIASNITYDAQLNFLTGLEIANSSSWPNWKENTYFSEYKAVRDKSMSSRK
ncbi:M20/M25/M40 family metallo-hydrolase [Flavobacteriaceae bacterium S356]|uniref:M20/M25/M40 family metallo-hydrolase n=1 Tax=Asprobacillus argus TaxID=3076534 RepID=A0ABU3LDG5_9FLAO|nr:M20/M25/M40 family metallo-hydrolase [Flavobacteriaceae bacterium S356]